MPGQLPDLSVQQLQQARNQGLSDMDIANHLLDQGYEPTYIKAYLQPQAPSLEEAATGAAKNIVPGMGRILQQTGTALMHPVQTVQTLGKVISGAMGELPGQEATPEEKQIWGAVKSQYAKYGSWDQFKTMLRDNPEQVMMDLSMLAGAGEATLPGRIGEVAGTVAKVADPLALAKGAISMTGTTAKTAIGGLTGAGRGAVEEALAGRPGFAEALRGQVAPESVVERGQEALQTMKDTRSAIYKNRLREISGDQTPLDLQPTKDLIPTLMKKWNIKETEPGKAVVPPEAMPGLEPSESVLAEETPPGAPEAGPKRDYSRYTGEDAGATNVEAAFKRVEEWGSQEGDLTPFGMDNLKKKLDDLAWNATPKTKPLILELKKSVTQELNNNVPGYERMTGDYEKMSSNINDIQKTLSLGGKASVDTALHKLYSVMRDDVNSNFMFRKSLADQLNNIDPKIMPQLAGATMSTLLPRGIQKVATVNEAGLAALHIIDPKFLALLPASSPRIAGEVLLKLGQIARGTRVGNMYEVGTSVPMQEVARGTSQGQLNR